MGWADHVKTLSNKICKIIWAYEQIKISAAKEYFTYYL